MVQLRILSGKKAGTNWDARRFPVRIGRSAANDLPLEENGIWDEHFELTFDRAEGFVLTACPDALVTVNHEPAQTVRLRNGDSIEVGAVRMRFWLGEDEGEVVEVAAGEVLHIPSNLPHKAEALETTLDVDVFCPPRQDWLDGSDAYLRRT